MALLDIVLPEGEQQTQFEITGTITAINDICMVTKVPADLPVFEIPAKTGTGASESVSLWS